MFINKIILYKALKETMEEYFQKTSLNGFGLLYYIRRRKYQRILWFFFILLGCTFASYVVFETITSFIEKPTVTTLAAVKEEIWQFPFPAIAICSENKISRRKVETYAKELANRSRSERYWQKKLGLFAGYYDHDAVDFDEAMDFELEMRHLLGAEYDSLKILKYLAADCEELLLECHLEGRKQECSKLFKMITTIAGHCCVFNHQGVLVKNTMENNKSRIIHYPNGTGIEMGLVLLLNSSTDDYFYKSRSTNGFHIQIFEVHIYPDTSVGSVNELMIPPGTDTEVELFITSQSIDDELRSFSLGKRRCYFQDENSRVRDFAYSASECLSWCRSRSVRELCECIPFHTPDEYLQRIKKVRVCSLMDLECMENFFVTWRTYRPAEFEGTEILRQESLTCPICYPLCGFKKYSYRKETVKLTKSRNFLKNRKYLTKITNDTSDVSLVKLYFSNQYVTMYNKKVLYNWYQILSNIGGIIGISIGCSIISGFEIFYFLTYRLLMNILKQRKVSNKA